jgi:hypothetical protein
MNQPVSLVIPLHLIVFGIIALACHGRVPGRGQVPF